MCAVCVRVSCVSYVWCVCRACVHVVCACIGVGVVVRIRICLWHTRATRLMRLTRLSIWLSACATAFVLACVCIPALAASYDSTLSRHINESSGCHVLTARACAPFLFRAAAGDKSEGAPELADQKEAVAA